MTTDTEMTKNVTRGQVRQYLRTIGKDPDDDVFRDIIESMEDEVEEDEWDDLAAQFRAAGAEVDMEKASQMTPGMTTPGPTMASDTTPGPTRVAPGHRREATIVGMGAIPATEPEDGGAIGAFSAPPGPVSPIHVAPRPVPPTEPAVPPDDEDHRPTLPHADVSAAAASSEWHQRPPAAPAPSPVVGPAPAERKSSTPWIRLGGLLLVAAVITGLYFYFRDSNDSEETHANTVESPVPNPGPTSQPTAPSPAPPQPTDPATITATCNVLTSRVENCSFPSGCTRVNPGSLYLQATCGAATYRASDKEDVLPLGNTKITLLKQGS